MEDNIQVVDQQMGATETFCNLMTVCRTSSLVLQFVSPCTDTVQKDRPCPDKQ